MMIINCKVLTEVNALTIIWLKDEEQGGRDCVSPMGRYDPKGGIP